MKYELLLVRYGEIGLKGKITRSHFETALINNMKNALHTKQVSHRIKKEWGRIYVYTDQIKKSVTILRKIFGITSISPCMQTRSTMDSVSKLAVNISKEALIRHNSFALRVTRSGEHEFTSQDVAVKVGNDIVHAAQAIVDLANPDFELFIEIRDENAYFFTEKIRGTGGLPYGTQGKILALIDRTESILAAWYLMRRGCKIIFVNTDVSFTDALNSFITKWYADSNTSMVDPRATKFYENLNKTAYERSCDAIVTGHTIYGNSQEGLSTIKQLKKHIKLPILYPLIAMEKDEINEKCREIGLQI